MADMEVDNTNHLDISDLQTASPSQEQSNTTQDDALSVPTKSIKKPKEVEYHLQNILTELLPEGTIVTEDSLERLSKAFTVLIEASSTAAAKAAVTLFNKTVVRPSAKKTAAKAHQVAKAKVAAKAQSRTNKKASNESAGTTSEIKRKRKISKKAASIEDNEGEFEVESILSHKIGRNGGLLFQIKWKGYPETESTWEGKDALEHCQDILKDYGKRHRLIV
ncbi:hypothetical protein BGX28_001100 [Mortierella sp. GBA30]|nr:hypothetical protein BGX28_001100 [Mortierella sp. GBA30]